MPFNLSWYNEEQSILYIRMEIIKAANKHHRFCDRLASAATLSQALTLIEKCVQKSRC